LLSVATAGQYEVQCRFQPSPESGEAVLTVGGEEKRVELAPGATECTFADITLTPSDVQLEVVLTNGDTERGVHQADLHKR
jgi:hypothetical protein